MGSIKYRKEDFKSALVAIIICTAGIAFIVYAIVFGPNNMCMG
jgi:hypothetical protein